MKKTAFIIASTAALVPWVACGQVPESRIEESVACWSCHAGDYCSRCHDRGQTDRAESKDGPIGGIPASGGIPDGLTPEREERARIVGDGERAGYSQGMSGWCDNCHTGSQSGQHGAGRHPEPVAVIDDVMCLSCHRAHAGGFGHGLLPESSVGLLLYDYGCEELPGVSALDPSGGDFAGFRRILCHRCHGMDEGDSFMKSD